MRRKPLWSGPIPRVIVNGLCTYEALALNTGLVPPITHVVHWARLHPSRVVRWGIPAIAGGLLIWAAHHLLIEQEESASFAEKGAVELSPLITRRSYH